MFGTKFHMDPIRDLGAGPAEEAGDRRAVLQARKHQKRMQASPRTALPALIGNLRLCIATNSRNTLLTLTSWTRAGPTCLLEAIFTTFCTHLCELQHS